MKRLGEQAIILLIRLAGVCKTWIAVMVWSVKFLTFTPVFIYLFIYVTWGWGYSPCSVENPRLFSQLH